MTKFTLVLLILATLLKWNSAHAQYNNQTIYGPNGNVVSRSTQSSSGQTTYYGPSGAVIGRTAPLSDGTLVIYGPNGVRTGTISPPAAPRKP